MEEEETEVVVEEGVGVTPEVVEAEEEVIA